MTPEPRTLIHGLYAITPDEADTARLLRKAELALRGGASVLQYRNKTASRAQQLAQAQALRELTRRFSVPLIINDDVQLAGQVQADGVHLGSLDAAPQDARATLGRSILIGVSCYNLTSRAREAMAAGADYVAFGAFFPSTVKPGAVAADLEILRDFRSELGRSRQSVPVVAIGGITAQNGAALIRAGADALAVISALFEAADIEAAARDFSGLFRRDSAT